MSPSPISLLRRRLPKERRRIWRGGVLSLVGWLLSPFTWWNDPVINIPLASLLARLFWYISPFDPLTIFLSMYMATNVAGIFLMYLGGEELTAKEGRRRRVLYALALSLLMVLVLLGLAWAGLLPSFLLPDWPS